MSGVGEKIARKYAKALFESFDEENYEGVERALHQLAAIWLESEDLRKVASSPAVLASEKEIALQEIGRMVAASAQVNPADHLARFLALVESNGRIHGLPEIAEAFSSILREYRDELRVTVITAREISPEERSEIEQQVKDATSRHSQIDWQSDENILGGVIIRAGDREIDGSVQGALADARGALLAS
ncbi:ATP synthase F1 subunit delta [bacterium]|nr:ATP synthase F1 subunit delta [bacterium]